ncbi:uncharacterized protein LOC128681692 isoform X2 [Plodia interpunctella]|uniref:uncharacterized protein LOC128681692 isoform X2 n=1 Tax=Plodia interpunctella TaxID=58824 RepID=UPI0031019685
MKFFVISYAVIISMDGFYGNSYGRNKPKKGIDGKTISEKFLSAEKGMSVTDLAEGGQHSVTFNIYKSKKYSNEFAVYILKHSKLHINFHSDYYIKFSSFEESNSSGPLIWAPYNCSEMQVNIDISKHNVLVDFHKPIAENHPKNWTLTTLKDSNLCEDITNIYIPCDYYKDGKYYNSLNYIVQFEVVAISIAINNKTLTHNHVFPHNMTYTYDYEYRPHDQRIVCTYEGLRPVTSQCIKTTNGSSVPFHLTSKLSVTLPLHRDDDGCTLHCKFIHEEIKADNMPYVTLLVNGTAIENGDTYPYVSETEDVEITINCLSTLEFKIENPMSVLILYKNNKLIREDCESQNETYNYKGVELSSLNATSVLKIPVNDEETVFKCSLEEKLNVGSFPYNNLSKTVTLKKKLSTANVAPTDTEQFEGDGMSDVPPGAVNHGIIGEAWFIPVVASLVVIIFITIACIIKVYRKNTKDTEDLVTPEDDHPNETPPPNFPQNATLEETYCKTFDNKLQNKYVTPFVSESIEELYAKPVKNALRKPQNEVLYASLDLEDNYAQVKPKCQRYNAEEPCYATVGEALKNEPTYASISNRSDYANDFGKGRYVNRNREEYVEPSYCEVGMMKKK